MSAITGICDLRAIWGSASASSWDGTATLTIWQPAAVSSAICCRVAFTSAVSVVVIDCTETGAPPPTATACAPLPTRIWRETRRGARGGGAAVLAWGDDPPGPPAVLAWGDDPPGPPAVLAWGDDPPGPPAGLGMPRLTVMVIALLSQLDRVEDVRGDQQHTETYKHEQETDTERDELLHVNEAWIGPAEQPGEPRPDPFEDNNCQFASVKRQEWQQVEQPDEDVHRSDDQHHERDLLLPGNAAGDDLPGHLADADHARSAAGLGPVRGEQMRNLPGQLAKALDGAHHCLVELAAGRLDRGQRADVKEGDLLD